MSSVAKSTLYNWRCTPALAMNNAWNKEQHENNELTKIHLNTFNITHNWQKVNTVRDQLTLCGVNNAINWHGQTQAQRIAADLFNDDHESARDMKFSDLTEDFKSYSALTVANGQIRLSPGTKRNIRAFIQWCKHVFRLGGDPALTPFPVGTTPTLLR